MPVEKMKSDGTPRNKQFGYKLEELKNESKGIRSTKKTSASEDFKVGDYVKMLTGAQYICKIVKDLGEGKYELRAKTINPLIKKPIKVFTNGYKVNKSQIHAITLPKQGTVKTLKDAHGPLYVTLLPDGEVLNGTDKDRLMAHYNQYEGKNKQASQAPATFSLTQVSDLLEQWGDRKSIEIARLADNLRKGLKVRPGDVDKAYDLLIKGELASGYWANDKEALSELRAIQYALNEVSFILDNCDGSGENYDEVLDHLKTTAGEEYLGKIMSSKTASFKYADEQADEQSDEDVSPEEPSDEDNLISISQSYDNGQFKQMVEQISEFGGLAAVLDNKESLHLSTGDLVRLCHLYSKSKKV